MADVLITEDDESLQSLYRTAFESAGYGVTVATNGADALDKVSHKHFDAVILDLLMLNMSGFDVLRQHNFNKESPNTKIIVVSNLDSPDIAEKAKSFGVDRYLLKVNYTPKQIVEIVTKLLTPPPEAKTS
jgi:two-component system, response regulator, stage 0 sporulation protein F